jgi:uncharacterized protein (DUF427 family)
MTTTLDQELRIEASDRRVRVRFGGQYVADSTRAVLVWEHPYYPTYYFPAADVRTDLLVASGDEHHSPDRGTADLHDLQVGDRTAPAAVSWYRDGAAEVVTGYVRFEWRAMDAWFEEDEEVFVHARNPYTRVDVLQSSRHVVVEVDGVVVADSHQPRLLFETGLPVRYYLPKTDVRMDLLRASEHHTDCPYKGTASYYDVVVDGTTHTNLAWWYPGPVLESAKIAGYVAFYDEKVDVLVDGVRQARPETPFSS